MMGANYDRYYNARMSWLEAEKNFSNAARVYNDLNYLRQERYKILQEYVKDLVDSDRELAAKDQFGS